MTDLFEPIAVIGMACKLPGARDIGEFWRNLAGGVDSTTRLTDEELLAAGVPAAALADPAYVKVAGLLPDVDQFDAGFFGFTPREAEVCDPQLRLFLEVTHQAVEDAGYSPEGIGTDVAVYGASGPSRYYDTQLLADPRYRAAQDMSMTVLNGTDYLATLASYKFDFRGPSMAVLTACSSSLAAVHLACRSLHLGECDVAVAGAANVDLPHGVGYRWTPNGVRSADGRCRPFDAAASGTLFSNGAAAVLLKRLSDAIADGDHVRAVIAGVGVSNDGSGKVSFSAPGVAGQSAAVREAMALAGYTARDVDCVEMHATGTVLGDPVEVAALAAAYREFGGDELAPGSIPVGSVKSNIGHTVATAGLAGLVKLVLALEHEVIPATLGVSVVNPRLDIDTTPFLVNDRLRPWRRTPDRPRRAGLTSLGVGGTNLHLVMAEGPVPTRTPHQNRPRVVVWSGRDEAALRDNRAALATYFADAPASTFADSVATLQRGRTAHPVRAAAVCRGPEDAAARLAGDHAVAEATAGPDAPPVVFCFPGQGSQHAAMATGLYGRQRVFTETVDVCLDGFDRHGLDLYPRWLAADPGDALHDTGNAQPLLFAVEYALAAQWREWGVEPAALLGHSVGELVAATVAGVIGLEDALRLVVLRGRVTQRLPRGGMLVAACAAADVVGLLPEGGALSIAVVNASDQTVLAGPDAELAQAAARLTAAGVPARRLRTSHAFHTPAMRPAAEAFAAGFAGVRLAPPAVPLFSAATGRAITDEQALDPGFWAGQLAEPVVFADALDAVTATGRGVLLEVGPGRAVTGLAKRHPLVRSGDWVPVAALAGGTGPRRSGQDEDDLLGALAELWVRGCPVDWSRVYRDEPLLRVPVPGYRFQRERFWVGTAGDHVTVRGEPPRPEEAVASPFSVPAWEEAERSASRTRPPGLALVLAPADDERERWVSTALSDAGHRLVLLRPGTEFTGASDECTVESTVEFTVRPDRLAEDVDRVLAALPEEPALLVHAWGLGAADHTVDELDRTFFALLDLVQRAGRNPVAGSLPALRVLTSTAADVSGGEPVRPARACLTAAVRSLRLESASMDCGLVDVDARVPVDALVAELGVRADDPVVALRGRRRWVPTRRPWYPRDGDPRTLRRAGVYVITGGLGGLGLAVAKELAATGREPRIALLGRTERDVASDLSEITATGARVTVLRCDVADPDQLGAALDVVAAEFGPVNGVLHLAGVAGGGMLHFLGRADAARVLRPKVAGTVALTTALAGRAPVDFVVVFSSQAALSGIVGGAPYAAANAFLDAHAGAHPGWLSVNWPAWTTVGMVADGRLDRLAESVAEATAPASGLTDDVVLSAATHWALDEHRIAGRAVLPGTGFVDLIVSAYLRTVPDATAPISVRDLVFLRPLVADEPQRVRVSFERADAGGWHVQVLARPEDGGAGWREHVRCQVVPDAVAPWSTDVAGLVRGLDESPVLERKSLPGKGFLFGPRWQSLERRWARDTETVVELALPAPFAGETADHAVHPALLDTVTGVLNRDSADLVVPFTYDSMTWFAPLPDRLYSHVRTRPGPTRIADVELIAPDGAILVAIRGLTMRTAAPENFGVSHPDTPTVTGLSPDEGVGLLMRLLESAAEGQVCVGVPRAEHPVEPAEPSAKPTTAPGSVEDRLATLWRQVLGRPRIDEGDNFFDLGGDSLSAVALTGRIRDEFGVDLSIGSLFDYPSLGAQAEVVREHGVGR